MRAPLLLTLALACAGDRDPPDTDGKPVVDTDPPSESADTGVAPPLTGEVAVSDAPIMVLEKRFVIALSRPAEVTLACAADGVADERHVLAASAGGELRLYGLLAETTYACSLTGPTGEELWAGETTTGSLPPGLPRPIVTSDSARQTVGGGWLVFNHWRNGPDKVHRGMVIDGEGRIRWYWGFLQSRSGGIVVTWTGEQMLAGGGPDVAPQLLNLSGESQFETPKPTGHFNFHHEAFDAGDGVLVGLTETPLTVQGITDCCKGFGIQAVDHTTGDVLFTYDVQDAVDAGEWAALPPTFDPFHANAAVWLDDVEGPAVWVSNRGLSQIIRIDRTTGETSWAMGRFGDFALLDPGGAPLPEQEWFYSQHGPELEGTLLRVFDNGSARPNAPDFTRAVEYEIDQVARTATKVWEWTEPGWHEPFYGDVDGLPSGNVLVGSGHCWDCVNTGGTTRVAFMAEIERATGDVVWRADMDDPRDSLYRAQYVPPCELFAHAGKCTALD